ncbi:MAG TPA: DUF2142 domain-containing protein, partial [Myxococcota bacterium]|nr:DUF2142 domain-containing protein [Myxococcota bacterium]
MIELLAPPVRSPWWSRPAPLLALGYSLLVGAWILASPPFAHPDEEDHYLRALSLGLGVWVGEPAFFPLTPGVGARAWAREAYVRSTTTFVRVPAGLSPAGFACNRGRPGLSAACANDVRPAAHEDLAFVMTGKYAPTAYLVPGALLRAIHAAPVGSLIGRLGSCAVPLALVLVAGTVCSAGRVRRAGLLLVLTPTAIATIASLNPSGLEIG